MLDLKGLGSRIKAARKSKNITGEALSDLINLKSGGVYVRMLEKGKRTPSLKMLVELSEALDVSTDYLLFDTLKQEKELPLEADLKEKIKLLSPRDLEIVNSLVDTLLTIEEE